VADPGQRDADIAEAFARIARRLQAVETRQQTWQQIVDLASELLPEFEHAAVSLVHPDGTIDTPAATGDIPRMVDMIQYETGEGPCLSAVREDAMYVTGDLSKEDRWPVFSARAVAETGVRSMLSFQLFVEEGSLGALNLFSESTDAFNERAQAFGGVLAAHAAIAMSAADEHAHVEQLEKALESNRDIGVAVGIVMMQAGTDRAGAFRRLSQASQRTDVKLKDIAVRIVEGVEAENRPV
jgi:transcriptional regulator with GAF, ATPase, and Fis domain